MGTYRSLLKAVGITQLLVSVKPPFGEGMADSDVALCVKDGNNNTDSCGISRQTSPPCKV